MTLSDTTPFSPEGSAGGKVSVVVIGAGYAGVLATNRFMASLSDTEREKVRLTVINARADFVERIRLHELAAGSRRSVTFPLSDILHREARRVIGTATAIDAKAQTVTTQTATGVITQRYDWLIYAPGSAASSPVAGAHEHAHLIADFEGAQSAARAVAAAAPGTRVVVVGGGFTGVETAAEVADHRPDLKVTLLSNGPILAHMRPAARRSIIRTGNRLGIKFVQDAAVQSITADALHLREDRSVDFDVCLVALSFTAPDLARVSGLAVDGSGRLRVDETLRSITAPNIIGAGDAVVAPPEVGSHLRMGCAVALPLGGHAAETVLHLMREEQPEPISIGLILQCLSLGRRRGYIQLVRADDSSRNMALNGRAGAAVKEMVSRMVVTSPRKEREKPGAYRAVNGPRAVRVHVPVARTGAGIMAGGCALDPPHRLQ
jgi:NADH dehydrogenase